MYVVLTSKPGIYRTEPGADIELIAAWDYVLHERVRAHFQLGRLIRETRVRVVDEGDASSVNWVPSKFLERFDTPDDGRRELERLCRFGTLDARLVPVPLAGAGSACPGEPA